MTQCAQKSEPMWDDSCYYPEARRRQEEREARTAETLLARLSVETVAEIKRNREKTKAQLPLLFKRLDAIRGMPRPEDGGYCCGE